MHEPQLDQEGFCEMPDSRCAICRSDRCPDGFLPILTPVLSMYCNELTSICRLCPYQYWRPDVSTLLPQCFHDNRDAYQIPLTVALFVQSWGVGVTVD